MNESIRRRRVTQADVARLAGVSQAMVSYMLNENANVTVPEETRRRILDAIAELGYLPNSAARSLRSDRTFTLATIIPDITNPFYPAFQRGIQDVAEQSGYDLILYNTDGIAEKEHAALVSVQKRGADGLIGVFFHIAARHLLPLVQRGLFVVRLEAEEKATGDLPLDNLYVDNRAAVRKALDYLFEKGHTRIGMLAGTSGPAKLRVEGYHQALADHGIAFDPSLLCTGEFTHEGGYRAMQTLLANKPHPQAVFASNDMMALGALLAVKAAGLRVPDDVALIGFDDIPIDRVVSPALTTVSQFQSRIGRKAVELLLERIEGKAPAGGRSVEMPFEIVVRESA
jgi:LacI family transcriptional regulator